MFITFEGIEGAGKSTMMARLASYMQSRGDTPVITREPGSGALGRRLRSLLLDCRRERIVPEAELCLFLADRAQHIAEVIRPGLEAGQAVLCDRYVDSTLAYQGYGRGMKIDDLRQMNIIAAGRVLPDLTILLDLAPQAGLTRAGERNKADGTVISEGRFDAESLEFHGRVRQGYLQLAKSEPRRFRVLDASRDVEAISRDCIAAYEELKERLGNG